MRARVWFLFLVLLSGPLPAAAGMPLHPPFRADEEMSRLLSEAAALALIHHLALTPEQRGLIKERVAPVRAEIEAVDRAEELFREEALKPRLEKAIADLRAGRPPSPPSPQERARLEALRGRVAGLFVKTDRAYHRILQVLTPEQRARLREFHPGSSTGMGPLLSPAGQPPLDPVRLIREIREASPEEIDRLIRRLSRPPRPPPHVPGGTVVRERRAERIRMLAQLVRRIRAMPQEEFEAKAGLLEEEVKALSPGPGGPRRGGAPPFRDRRGLTRQIVFSEAFYDAL